MSGLKFIEVNDNNKIVARELLAGYGHYLFDELKLMAGNDSFFTELEKFPDAKYKSPNGAFFIIYDDENPIGCVGLKRFDSNSCELKRMYIKEEFRGRGFGKTIVKFIADIALRLGYEQILLDTNVEMPAAVNAYLKAGFIEIPAYCENENPNPVFLSLLLNSSKNS
jgi:GNAT superfamily N-acetyltransferase